jgi:hypothetical protein
MLKIIKSLLGKNLKYTPLKKEYHFNGERHIQVVAVKSWKICSAFGDFYINEGDVSGFIQCRNDRESEDLEFHLSQFDNSWLADKAKLSGLGRVKGNSWVGGQSVVTDSASVEDSIISDFVEIIKDARIYRSIVSGKSKISGNLHTCEIHENTSIIGPAQLTACQTYGQTKIIDKTSFGSLKMGFAIMKGNVCIDFTASSNTPENYPFDDMLIMNCKIQSENDLRRAKDMGLIKERQDGRKHLDAIRRRR